MPVRRMTDQEAELIFGSGLVIVGMKRSTEPSIQNTGDTPHRQAPRISGVAPGGEDFREHRDPVRHTLNQIRLADLAPEACAAERALRRPAPKHLSQRATTERRGRRAKNPKVFSK